MGVVGTITADRFPRQGSLLGRKVRVCYHYDTNNFHSGVCIRDDLEKPFETVFLLENGRVVRAVECQYQTVDD